MNPVAVIGPGLAPPAPAACWDSVGVGGDRSCPQLAEVAHCRNCPVYAAAARALSDRPPPPGYAAEWTARVAEPDAPPEAVAAAMVFFRVGPEWYALDVACAAEVAPARAARRLPHSTRPALVGLVNFRGELLLAVTLAGLLGTEPGEPGRLLVIERAGERFAVLTDEVHGVAHAAPSLVSALPATVAAGARPLTRGVLAWQGKTVGLLDPARLFSALAGALR